MAADEQMGFDELLGALRELEGERVWVTVVQDGRPAMLVSFHGRLQCETSTEPELRGWFFVVGDQDEPVGSVVVDEFQSTGQLVTNVLGHGVILRAGDVRIRVLVGDPVENADPMDHIAALSGWPAEDVESNDAEEALRLTEVVAAAQAEARALGSTHVSSEHLLIAILCLSESGLTVTPEYVRSASQRISGGAPPDALPVDLPFSAYALRALGHGPELRDVARSLTQGHGVAGRIVADAEAGDAR